MIKGPREQRKKGMIKGASECWLCWANVLLPLLEPNERLPERQEPRLAVSYVVWVDKKGLRGRKTREKRF